MGVTGKQNKQTKQNKAFGSGELKLLMDSGYYKLTFVTLNGSGELKMTHFVCTIFLGQILTHTGLRRIVKTFRYVKTYRCRDKGVKITSSKSLVSQAQWLIQRVWRIILRLTILISLETQKTNGEIDSKSI